MIEQTELIVREWQYHPPVNYVEADDKLSSSISLDVMKKRAVNKKGIACRFTCRFNFDKETMLLYVAEDSYVIDLEDSIDVSELQTMIRNSFSKFKEKFDLRKLGTLLQDKTLAAFDDTQYDLVPVLGLLK